MQAVERKATQLVRQFHAAPPRQQVHAATALVEFCNRQPEGREWQDAGCRGLELWLRSRRLPSQATLPSNTKLPVLLEALSTLITITSLLPLQQGRYLI
jgi:hypothetical protein